MNYLLTDERQEIGSKEKEAWSDEEGFTLIDTLSTSIIYHLYHTAAKGTSMQIVQTKL